jgi:hypothetical protein
MTFALILNAILGFGVFAVVIVHHAWSILTQHRDRPHVFVRDSARRRRQLGRRPPQAEPRPAYARSDARRGQAWPAS